MNLVIEEEDQGTRTDDQGGDDDDHHVSDGVDITDMLGLDDKIRARTPDDQGGRVEELDPEEEYCRNEYCGSENLMAIQSGYVHDSTNISVLFTLLILSLQSCEERGVIRKNPSHFHVSADQDNSRLICVTASPSRFSLAYAISLGSIRSPQSGSGRIRSGPNASIADRIREMTVSRSSRTGRDESTHPRPM